MSRCRLSLFTSALILALCCAQLRAADRKEVRILYDFEDPGELEDLKKSAENATFDIVQDNGVTHGKNCCRVVFKQGGDYGVFFLGDAKIKNWGDFDYFAMDVFMERESKVSFSFELMDGLTKGYPTRCTIEPVNVKQGKNSIVIPINRAKRNGKEGRDWEELEPKDKMQMNALTKVKLFLNPPKDGGDLVWWIDNVRVLQEDALGGKMKVDVPAGTTAFVFGHRGTNLPGFFTAENAGEDARGFTLGGNIENCGKHWPDPLTGDGVYDPKGGVIRFEKTLPDGDYFVWLASGMVLKSEIKQPHYLLKIGSETIVDESPSADDLAGEKYLFRFLKTQYSERENALFTDYIERMYPVYEKKISVTGGKLSIQASGHFLSALIVMPVAQEAAFKKLTAEIRAERIRSFNSTLSLDPQKKPAKKDGDGPFVCFIPDDSTVFSPATAPTDAERARKNFDLAGAPGQHLTLRLGIVPFDTIGKCRLEISELKGPAAIPASAARIYFQDYRVRGDSAAEAALMPSSELNVEKGVSSCWWAWLKIPDDAAAGDYSGTVKVTPAAGQPVTFPVKLKVYPFKLEEILPYSFGMYYSPPVDKKKITEQLTFMREIGFTGTCVGGGTFKGLIGNGVDLAFDPMMFNLAKAAGMGRHPLQYQMGNSLGVARAIGRNMGAKVDQNPGSEMALPGLKPAYLDACKKYAEFIKSQGLPVAVEIVDEPREVPNPWNRNLKDTNTYGDWLKEAGIFPTFVTPMGDGQNGLDYTSLIDHADIISTHAGKGSERLMKMTPEKKKMLWLYNTGMDRLSWGFYNWRMGSVGRWEWHFCFFDPGSNSGYINDEEWFNPFTSADGFAPHAPNSYPGAMLFKSVFFTCSEGITDAAYIVTLEKAIAAAEGNAAKAATAAKAKEYLASLKQTIPFLPGVKNIANEAAGALVGTGLNAEGTECESWRRKIAEFLTALK
jgi:hypothetical protein